MSKYKTIQDENIKRILKVMEETRDFRLYKLLEEFLEYYHWANELLPEEELKPVKKLAKIVADFAEFGRAREKMIWG